MPPLCVFQPFSGSKTLYKGFEAARAKNLRRTAVWRVQIEEITGKRKKYGPDGAERKADGA